MDLFRARISELWKDLAQFQQTASHFDMGIVVIGAANRAPISGTQGMWVNQ